HADVLTSFPTRRSSDLDVNFITGAVILIRASALWKAGGWDVDTFTYAEDSDLCWRILLLDYRVVYEPKAVSYHAQSPTMGRASRSEEHTSELQSRFDLV